ncbi:MAG: inositol monophosphatase family protein [Rubrimonas sp.]|uniref:inositol monophosphatase family protein n=1 Tax=Rubrimonas sp. TaxID=2036015 RepID=UPI002FDD2378
MSPAPDGVAEPADDLALLVAAVEAAGEGAMRWFGRAPRVWDKEGGAGPVTEADLEADAALKARLRAARPGYGWLSEETPDDRARLGCASVFVVDPIDGTRAFIAGETGWCVAAAVAAQGAPVAAAAFFPALGRLYAARAGGGASRDGAPIRAAEGARAGGALALAASAQLGAEHWPGGAPALRRAFRPSMIHRLCLVAEGAADVTLSFRELWEWDLAAGALIAAEAGCVVSDGRGRTHSYNAPDPRSDGVIAAPPALHAELVRRRRPRGGD